MRRTLDEIVSKLRDHAVEQQKEVVGERDDNVQTVYAGLDKARKTNDFDLYDRVSADVIKAITVAKGSVSDLRLLRAGDFDSYVKSQKLLDGEAQ